MSLINTLKNGIKTSIARSGFLWGLENRREDYIKGRKIGKRGFGFVD